MKFFLSGLIVSLMALLLGFAPLGSGMRQPSVTLPPTLNRATPTPAFAPLPTQQPRIYTQAEINRLYVFVEETYGVRFAYPGEWQANSAGEVMLLADYLYEISAALDTFAVYLHAYGGGTSEVTPLEFFRLHFERANLQFDRASSIPGGFAGNTLPMLENGRVTGYMIQLTPQAMNSPFVLIHELGHVLDGLLNDQPQQDFIRELGGEWGAAAWIPGEGYLGNETLFPRAVAGPNEDFADTFGQMLTGGLSWERGAVRYQFMLTYLPRWLATLRALDENVPSESSSE